MIKVLIIEDDTDLGNLLKQYLKMNGFSANRVFNAKECREKLKEEEYDILIVDVMMPEEDGFELIQKLKLSGNEIPFLFVTAKNRQEDILHGLKLGADDYMTKPFDADELILRIQNIVRRTRQETVENPKKYKIGKFYTFDVENLVLASDKNTKILTEKEAKLLDYLYQNRFHLIKRESILNYLWHEADFFNGRSMDVFISRLRKYLADDSNIKIESIRGIGFRFYCED